MKIFKTSKGALPFQSKIYIIQEDDITKIVQVDSRGKYISEIDNLNIPTGKYAIDKDEFFNAMKILGKEYSTRVTKRKLIFSENTKSIELPLGEYDLSLTFEDKYEFKKLPENFSRIFTKATTIALDPKKMKDKKINLMAGIHIKGDKVYAGDNQVLFKGILSEATTLDVILFSDIFLVIENPLEYALEKSNIAFKSSKGIAILKCIDGIFPNFEPLIIDEPVDKNILKENAYKALFTSIAEARLLGHDALIINVNCEVQGSSIVDSDRDGLASYKNSVNLKIPNKAKFSLYNLKRGLINDRVYCEGNNSPMYVFKDDMITVISAIRFK